MRDLLAYHFLAGLGVRGLLSYDTWKDMPFSYTHLKSSRSKISLPNVFQKISAAISALSFLCGMSSDTHFPILLGYGIILVFYLFLSHFYAICFWKSFHVLNVLLSEYFFYLFTSASVWWCSILNAPNMYAFSLYR